MSDHHHHQHDHTHAGRATEGGLTETDKLLKRLHHWIHHNDDHAGSYSDWAHKVARMGFAEAARRLNAAAEMTHAITREFEAAAAAIREQARKG